MLTQEYLKSILHYDLETGIWTWLVKRRPNIKIGNIAGNKDFYGYIRIKIDGKTYRAHRLAWFYMTGEWPEDQLDHKNLNKSNNVWDNLREANNSKNQANKYKYSNNTSGIKGVVWDKQRSLWRAQIRTNKKTINLGRYVDKNQAALAYEQAAIKYHGEFAKIDI